MPDNVEEMDLAGRKGTLRRIVLAKRAAIVEDDRDRAANAVVERLLSLPEISAAPSVLAFASFGTEVSTDRLLERLLALRKRLLLPYVDGPALRAAEVRSLEELAAGYGGIREPIERVSIDAAEAGVVVVPGVAFDASGRRLGHGGGFYDALLAPLPRSIPRIGVCFEVQVVDEVPAGPGDEPVDIVVTERRVIRRGNPFQTAC